MITQNLPNYAHTEVTGGFRSGVDHLVQILIERVKTHKETQSRRELYNYYQKFTIEQLRDMGIANPQDQLRTLGRYLRAGSIDKCECRL